MTYKGCLGVSFIVFGIIIGGTHRVAAFSIQDSQTVVVTATVVDPNAATSTAISTAPASGGYSWSSGFSGGGGGTGANSVTAVPVPPAQSPETIAVEVSNLITYGDQQIVIKTLSLTNIYNQIETNLDLSQDQKTILSSEVKDLIQKLGALKIKIDNDSIISNLQVDVNRISSMTRVSRLIAPKIRIAVSVSKLYRVITLAKSIGVDLKSKLALLTDQNKVRMLTPVFANFMAQVADATQEGMAAESAESPLAPDQGSIVVQQSNKALLTAALAHIALGTQDLSLAWSNAEVVWKGLQESN